MDDQPLQFEDLLRMS